MKLIDNVRHTHCQYGIVYDELDYGVLPKITQWLRDNMGGYYYEWDWLSNGSSKTICFNSEEKRTWFILRWSHELY